MDSHSEQALMNPEVSSVRTSWTDRTTLGIGLTGLFSDWSHEIATSILPAFLASLGERRDSDCLDVTKVSRSKPRQLGSHQQQATAPTPAVVC